MSIFHKHCHLYSTFDTISTLYTNASICFFALNYDICQNQCCHTFSAGVPKPSPAYFLLVFNTTVLGGDVNIALRHA